MAKKLEIKEIDLYSLKNAQRWKMIKRMTVRGWCAREAFDVIENEVLQNLEKTYDVAKMLLLYVNGKSVAWNFHISGDRLDYSSQIWAFTRPKYRRQGFQKILLKKSRKMFGKSCYYQDWDLRQQKTFKYYASP